MITENLSLHIILLTLKYLKLKFNSEYAKNKAKFLMATIISTLTVKYYIWTL